MPYTALWVYESLSQNHHVWNCLEKHTEITFRCDSLSLNSMKLVRYNVRVCGNQQVTAKLTKQETGHFV